MTKEDIKLLAEAGYITNVTLFDDSVDLDEVLIDPAFTAKYITQMGMTEEVINGILADIKGELVTAPVEPEPKVVTTKAKTTTTSTKTTTTSTKTTTTSTEATTTAPTTTTTTEEE